MRRFAILLGAFVLIGLPGCVQSGVVWTVDAWDRTLKIGDDTYQVTPQTELLGPDGEHITLERVPSGRDPRIGVRTLARAEVEFLAHEQAGEKYIDSLWVRHP